MPDNEVKKPDCYKCKYRGTIPGDAHSCCNHPEVQQDDNMFGAIMDVMAGKNNVAIKKLGIKGSLHGIRSGWFLWPANFDPIWLESCNGFKSKEGAHNDK